MYRFLIVCVCAVPALAEDFTQFRGSGGNGQVADQPIPLNWSLQENLAWNIEVPGSGWAQPIIFGDRIYVASAVSEKDLTPANFADGVKSPQSMGVSLFAKPPSDQIKWTLHCIKLTDGSLEWSSVVHKGKAKYSVHPSNSYATESPVADENGIYVYFGASGKVAALGHDGSLRWQKDIGVFKTSNKFGTGSSLTIHEGKIYAQNFNEESCVVYCFDAANGSEIWTAKRENRATSWSTPVVWKNAQRHELVTSGGDEVTSYDPTSGKVLWNLKNVKASTACSISTDTNHIYFGGSDPFSKGPLFAVSSGGTGDLSPEKKNARFSACSWLAEKQGPGMASPVSSGQHVYVVDKNILKCFDAATGERKYQSRLPGMKMVAASPLVVGDRLLMIDEYGKGCVVATGPEFKVLGQSEIDDTIWSTPAVADGAVIVRGVKGLYCFKSNSK